MMPHKLRETIFQLLFSIDMGNSREEDLIPFCMHQLSMSRKVLHGALQKAKSVWEAKEALDAVIAECSKSYEFDRICCVERNILRLSAYALLLEKELSKEMVISEALRLCRKFTTPEASKFVNAILDGITVPPSEEQTAM